MLQRSSAFVVIPLCLAAAVAPLGCGRDRAREVSVDKVVAPLRSATVCVTVLSNSGGMGERDAEIRLDQPNTNFGKENTAQVGIPQPSNERRSLFFFDLGAVPAHARVSSATVTLKGGNAAFGTIDV